jgi:hypothetical protein
MRVGGTSWPSEGSGRTRSFFATRRQPRRAAAREWIKASRAAREDWLSRAIRSHLSPTEQEELAKAAALLRRIVD